MAKSEEDALKEMGRLLELANKSGPTTEATGACVYNAAGKTYWQYLRRLNAAN